MNIWKVKIWLPQERKKLLKSNKKIFVSQVLSFRLTKQTSKNVADTTLKSYGISGQISGFVSSFLSNRRLRMVWMVSLHKNTQLMLEFLQAPFLFLHFPYYTLMTFLMILSVILLSMLMILLSTLSEIRHLICGNN